ncbi:MAG TPA: helix-turn-helix domain-containing protein [Ramlibacter sp.]|nr:helix-turn-helix domain-containing protein [Ramlibacter sp.]
MIERASEFGQSAAVPLVSGDTSQQSAGDMLRQAREAHGLDVAVVAAALKVPVQKIEALEADDIDALPDPVFARALAASMCRALRIDAKPVLSKLPDARNPDLHTRPAMSSGFHTEVQRSNGGNLGSRTMLTVVGVLLVAAAALFWLPQSWLDQLSASVDRVLTRGDKVAEAPAADATSGAQATVAEPAQVPAPAASVTAPPAPAAALAAVAEPAAAPAHLLVFSVRAESWISVTEAGGKQLVHRTVPAGETVALSGTPPLSVVVGRASGVDVQVRGKAFDLAPLARGGSVARFEVKP